MPRIPEILTKADLAEDKHHIFDAIAESRGRVGFPFSLLLNSPEVAGRIAHVGTYVRFESILSPVEREIAILTAAREADCEFEWSAHTRLALQAGVRQEAIDIIGGRRALDALTAEEALIVEFGRDILRNHRVSESTFEKAMARYGVQGTVDLAATMGYYTMLACALNAFEAEPYPGAPRLP